MSDGSQAGALEIQCANAIAGGEGESAVLPALRPEADFGLKGLVATARPRQWAKNLLVFAAPGTAGLLTDPEVIALAAGAFVVFCVAASGTYFLNDALGVAADRVHPTKSQRPVAAGAVNVGLAKVLGTSLLLTSVALAMVLAGWRLALMVGIYAAIQPLYSAWLRSVPIADLVTVAAGFVLRAVAGGVAAGVPISRWFLIVTSFGSLFLVSGKRTAEHIDLGEHRCSHRSTLGVYSLAFLRHMRSVTAVATITAYCVWAVEKSVEGPAAAPVGMWFALSVIPFVLVTLRYRMLLDAGKGGCPEQLVFEDRLLEVLAVVWVVTVAIAVHAG